jgi:hypothetical protein
MGKEERNRLSSSFFFFFFFVVSIQIQTHALNCTAAVER